MSLVCVEENDIDREDQCRGFSQWRQPDDACLVLKLEA